MKKKVTFLNILSSLFLQFITIVSGLIIPKLILNSFGSNVNGLISSLNQFLSYITLVEGGITGVITANLYKPLVDKNYSKLSSIMKTTNSFYINIGIIFVIYSVLLAIIYPLFFAKGFSYLYIFTLTLILSISLLIQYMFSLSLRTLLTADKKVYVVANTQSIIVVINIILTIISIKFFPNIHFIKFINGILFVFQPLWFSYYVKKNYKIEKNVKKDNNLLKNRWDGFAINVAAFIHFSTDITILTIFTDLATVSIYSVYSLVSTGLKSIINSISNGINPTIGQAYARGDDNELNEKLDLYEYIVDLMVFSLFNIAALLITPFVLIYTKDITDANYNQPMFGYFLLLSEALYLLKYPHLNLSYSANKFKDITKPAYIEAFLNVIISIILVNKYGIIGVAIGTTIAMLYRMIFHVSYTKRILKNRTQWRFYKKLIVFIVTSIIGLIICSLYPFSELNILNWLIHAVIYSIIFGILYFVMSLLFFKKEISFLINYLIKGKKKNKSKDELVK